MAKQLTYEEYKKKYGENVSTTFTNSDGSVDTFTPSQLNQQNLSGVLQLYNDKNIYKTGQGSYSFQEPSKTSISLNKDTGKISVSAPSYVTNRDEFKNSYIPLLEKYSSAYKTDKNVAYQNNENPDGETKDTETVLKDIENALNDEKFITNARTMQQLKDSEESKTGFTFSDDDLVRRYTLALGSDVKDNTRQIVPDVELFTNLETYDKATGTAELKDILENAYNREKTSDEDILAMISEYTDYAEKGFKDDKSEDAKEKYIRSSGFSEFLNNRSPQAGFIRATGDWLSNLFYASSGTAAEMIAAAEGIPDALMSAFAGGSLNKEGSFEKLDDVKAVREEHERKTKLLNSNAMIAYNVGEIATHIVASIAAGQVAGGLVSGTSESLAALTGADKAIETANAVSKLVETASIAYKASDLGTVATTMALSAVNVAANMNTAMSAVLLLASASEMSNMINSAFKLIGKVSNATVEGLASGVIEASANNPTLFARVMSSQSVDEEAKSAIMEEWAWNVGGWGVGVGIEKSLFAFGKTMPGRVLSDNLAILGAKVRVMSGNAADAIKVRFSKYGTIDELAEAMKKAGKSEKYQQFILNRALRSELKSLSGEDWIKTIGKDSDEIMDSIKRVDGAIKRMRTAENALTVFESGARRTIKSWIVNNKLFSEAYTDTITKAGKVVDAEKAAGLAARATGTSDIGTSGRLFSQTTTNYIGARNEQVRINWLIEHGDNSSDVLNAADDIEAKILAFKKLNNPELEKAVDEFIVSQRALYYRMTNVFMEDGLENSAEINYYRSTGQWGENGKQYAYAMRQGELSDVVKMNRNGTFRTRTFVDDMHYSYGATGDYADPILAIEDKLIEHAKVKQRRELYKAFGDTEFVNKVVKISAEQTEMQRIVTDKVRKDYKKAIKSYLRGTSENLLMKNADEMFAEIKRADLVIAKTPSDKRSVRKAYNSLANKTWKANSAERAGYILSMDGDDITDGMDELFGIRSWDELGYSYATTVDGDIITNGTYPFETFYNNLSSPAKKYLDNKISDFSTGYLGKELSKDMADKAQTFRQMLDEMGNGDDIARNILANTKTYRDSDWITSLANSQKTLANQVAWQDRYSKELDSLNLKLGTAMRTKQDLSEQLGITIDNTIDEVIKASSADQDIANAFNPILKATGDVLDDTTKQYFILKTMIESPTELRAMSDDVVSTILKGKGASDTEINALKKEFYPLLKSRMNDSLNNLALQLKASGSTLVDDDSIFQEIEKVAKDIKELDTANDIIIISNDLGQIQYVQVNPMFADLMNTQPVYKEMSKIQKVNYLWSKLWRMGTTGLNLKSIMNQMSKDTINAFVGGGMMYTTKQLIPRVTDVFGESVVDYIKNFEPENFDWLTKEAKNTGRTLEEVATEDILTRGRQLAEEGIETKAYQLSQETRFAKFVNGEQEKASMLDRAIDKLDDYMNSKFSINRINDLRETTLRGYVYSNAMSDALRKGDSVQDAIVYATQLMDDATTNFSRSMYHLRTFQKSTPYLGAAVNGTKSFWRLASLDPVGVFSRMFGGLVIPTMALTAVSLSSKENRDAWKNLKEYEKDGNLCFALNGQIFTIPMPEEIGNLVNPFRQLVEGMSSASNHSFWELAANDILSISPVDLTGFTQLDAYTLAKDPTAWDRISNGTIRIASQILPPPARAAATLMSGRDLYTGQEIDKTYKQFNEETGQAEVMGDYSGQFAKALAGIFTQNGIEVSAPMMEEIFSQIIGAAGLDFLNTLTNYGAMVLANEEYQKQIGATWQQLPENVITNVTSPYTVTQYKTLANSAWKVAVNNLYAKKTAILNDKTYLGLVQSVNEADTQEKRFAAKNRLNTYLKENFYDELKNVVDRLGSEYSAEFTPTKYASVLSLANFGSGVYGVGSANSAAISSQLYYEGKQQAVDTMRKLGFSNADSGIFGYIKSNSNGEAYIAYTTPLQILDAENMAYYKGTNNEASLEEIINNKELTRKKMFGDDYKKAKNNGKSALKAYKSEWNSKVVNAIAPYVNRYGVDSILENRNVIDMLDEYLFVDNPYKTKDYIKALFK